MCTTFVAKLVVSIVNTLIFLAGAAMFVIGLLIETQPSFSQEVLSSLLSELESAAKMAGADVDTSGFSAADIAYAYSMAIMVIGLVLAAISVLGLIGVKYGLKPVLLAYFIITLVLLLAQLTVVLVAVIDRNAFDDALKPQLKRSIKDEFQGLEGKDAVSQIWNGVMLELKCCGVDSYDEFSAASKWTKIINGTSYALITPVVCCKTVSKDFTCAENPTDAINNWKTGCYTKIWDYVVNDSALVIVIAAGVLISQFALLILTYIIIKSDGAVGSI